MLGSILTLAGAGSQGDPWRGTYLLLFYSIGLSIPFLITGLALSDVTPFLRRIQRFTPIIEVGSGLMILSIGVLLVTGHLTVLNQYFNFANFNGGL